MGDLLNPKEQLCCVCREVATGLCFVEGKRVCLGEGRDCRPGLMPVEPREEIRSCGCPCCGSHRDRLGIPEPSTGGTS